MASSTSSIAPSVSAPSAPVAIKSRFTGLDLALIISMCFWGGNFVFVKAAADVIPPLAYNVLRFGVAAACTYGFMRWRRIDLHFPRREAWPIIRAAILAYLLYQPFFVFGIQHTTAGNTALILTAGPIWVVLINGVTGRDRVTRSIVVGVLMALGGVLVVVFGRYAGQVSLGGSTLTGDFLELIASLLWGLGSLATSYPLARAVNTIENGGNGSSPMAISFWLLIAGAASQLLYGLPSFVGLDLRLLFTPTVLLALFVSGICAITFGTIVVNVSVGRRGTSRTGIYNYLQPFVAALLGAFLLGETFTPWLIVGGVLIGIGVWLVRRS